MKQYVVDELRPDDFAAMQAYLTKHCHRAVIEGVFWLFLDDAVLSACQAEHTSCQPFYVALELTRNQLACELLLRSEARLRCDCMAYANETQLAWLIAQIDAIFENLGIIT